VFLGIAAAASLAMLYVAANANPRSLVLVQAAAGVVVGMFLQPATSGVVALLTAVLALRALPRDSFTNGTLLFALGVAVGLATMILTSTTPARC
jgi:hypothetical protein